MIAIRIRIRVLKLSNFNPLVLPLRYKLLHNCCIDKMSIFLFQSLQSLADHTFYKYIALVFWPKSFAFQPFYSRILPPKNSSKLLRLDIYQIYFIVDLQFIY